MFENAIGRLGKSSVWKQLKDSEVSAQDQVTKSMVDSRKEPSQSGALEETEVNCAFIHQMCVQAKQEKGEKVKVHE